MSKFLRNKSNWVAIITFILAVIGVFVSIYCDNLSGKVISGMFVMLSIENFIIQMNYLEYMKEKIKRIEENSKAAANLVRFIGRESYNHMLLIENAKNNLFISGATNISWANYASYLTQKSEQGLRIRILVNDVASEGFLDAYKALGGTLLSCTTLDHLDIFFDYPNIEIRKTTKIMPIVFAAYDIWGKSGYMQVTEHFGGISSTKHPVYELTPENGNLYNTHCEYIEFLWDTATIHQKVNVNKT